MTRIPLRPHRFEADDEATSWDGKRFCRRCGFPRISWFHTKWEEPPPDDSDRIIGERAA